MRAPFLLSTKQGVSFLSDMPALPPEDDSLLSDLRTALVDLYGDRLVQLVLYGSQARGDTHTESDVDVLIVLESPVEPGREVRRMRDVRTRIGLRHEQALSLLPVSEAEYQNRSSPWLANARRDGKGINRQSFGIRHSGRGGSSSNRS